MALELVGDRAGRVGTFHRGDRLKKAREEAGISVQDMARRLDVDRHSISRYERTGAARKLVVEAYARHTGFAFEWLWTGQEVPTGHIVLDTIGYPVVRAA